MSEETQEPEPEFKEEYLTLEKLFSYFAGDPPYPTKVAGPVRYKDFIFVAELTDDTIQNKTLLKLTYAPMNYYVYAKAPENTIPAPPSRYGFSMANCEFTFDYDTAFEAMVSQVWLELEFRITLWRQTLEDYESMNTLYQKQMEPFRKAQKKRRETEKEERELVPKN